VKKVCWLAAFACAALWTSLCDAQDAASAPQASRGMQMLSIDEAVNAAVDHNFNLLAARANLTIAEAQMISARLRPNSYFNQLRASGAPPAEAAFQGAQVRLRTVLMTTLLAMLGLTPMALSHAIGSEVQKPLAVVIIGGLFSAAALTLIVLPVLYVVFEEVRGREPVLLPHQAVPEALPNS